MQRFLAPKQWTPVVALDGARERYPSVAAAARALGCRPNALREAVIHGRRCRGRRWTWADLRTGCAPAFRPAKHVLSVECVDTGLRWPSLYAAAGGDQRIWMQMWRAIQRERPWNGMTLRLVGRSGVRA